MSLRDDVMELMDGGDWWTVPMLARALDMNPYRSHIFAILAARPGGGTWRGAISS